MVGDFGIETQRVVVVTAPGTYGAIRAEGNGTIGARANPNHASPRQKTLGVDRHRHHTRFIAVVAKSPAIIRTTPPGDSPVRSEHQSEVIAGGHGDDDLAGEHPAGVDRDRDRTADRPAVAELAVAVAAPGGEGAIRTSRHAEIIPCGDCDDRLAGEDSGRLDRDRQRAVSGGAIAELAVQIIAPCGQGAIRAKCDAVGISGGKRGDGLARQHAGGADGSWCTPIAKRTKAELPNPVVAPRVGLGAGPLQHQVIAGAAVVVGHKPIAGALIGKFDRLTLGEIGERAGDKGVTRVVDDREPGTGGGRIAQRQVHRIASRRVVCGSDRNGVQRHEGRLQRHQPDRRDRVGRTASVQGGHHHADRVRSRLERKWTAGAARWHGNAVDRDGSRQIPGCWSQADRGGGTGEIEGVLRATCGECRAKHPAADAEPGQRGIIDHLQRVGSRGPVLRGDANGDGVRTGSSWNRWTVATGNDRHAVDRHLGMGLGHGGLHG